MKVCKKSQKLFLYTNSRKVKNIFHYVVHMKEDVEYGCLVKAVGNILPYIKSLAITIYKDSTDFYYEENQKEPPVYPEIREDRVLIQDTNDYPFAVSCQGRSIRFDIAHACMDGYASFMFLQYLLGNYIYIRYGEIIDHSYVEEKTEEDIRLADMDYSEISMPEISSEDRKEVDGFEPDLEISKTCNRFCITYDEEQVKQYADKYHVKNYSILIGVFAATFENMYHRQATLGFPINMRRRLQLNESLHNCSAEVIMDMPLMEYCSDAAYFASVQDTLLHTIQSDVPIYNISKSFEFIDVLMESDYPLSMKQRIFRKGMSARTFHFSYMNRFPNGDKFKKYIEDMDMWVPVYDYPLYVVSVRLNGKIKLYVTHRYDENILLSELEKVLEKYEIDYKIDQYSPYKDGAIEYKSL